MKKVLLDTSVIIDFLRRKDKDKTLLFTLAQQKIHLYISIITHTELYAGKSVWEKKKAKEELEVLFSGMKILSLEPNISQKAGEIKAKHNVNLLDAIVASTAIISGIDLVTLNVKDFEKVKGLNLFTDSFKN